MTKVIFILSFLIAAIIFFLFVPISQFPKPKGPYGVGQTQHHWIDESRKELNTDDPKHPYREMMVSIFYPTEKTKNAKRIFYDKDAAKNFVQHLGRMSKLPAWLFRGIHFIKTSAQWNVPIAKSETPFPVIFFSHGFAPKVRNSTWSLEELASHGFIVVGIEYPYIAAMTRFSGDRIVKSLVFKKKKASRKTYMDWKLQQVGICAQDISFVINKLKEHAKQKDELWSTNIDTDKIGHLGHSFGGSLSVRICRTEKRMLCGIDMDGALRGEDIDNPFSKPFMFLVGEKSNQWIGKEGKDLEDIRRLSKANKNTHMITIKDHNHSFTIDVTLALNAMLVTRLISYFYYDDFLLGLPAPQETNVLVNLIHPYIIDFLEKHLKDKPSKLLPNDRGELVVGIEK
jgi:hypothetical protein